MNSRGTVEEVLDGMDDHDLALSQLQYEVGELAREIEALCHIVRILCGLLNKPLADTDDGTLMLWEDRPQ